MLLKIVKEGMHWERWIWDEPAIPWSELYQFKSVQMSQWSEWSICVCETGVGCLCMQDIGYNILLDKKPLKTPAGRPLVIPSIHLALAIAAEWEWQVRKFVVNEINVTVLENFQPEIEKRHK